MREISNLINTGIGIFPNIHNALYSHAQLSDQRKMEIALRRDKLKTMDEDPPILKIIIEEILAYKPRFFTLDDRYLQLEKILDAIEKARIDKDTDRLSQVCLEIHNQLLASPGRLKNSFFECLAQIKSKIEELQSTRLRAKL